MIKRLVLGHTVTKWKTQNLNPLLLDSRTQALLHHASQLPVPLLPSPALCSGFIQECRGPFPVSPRCGGHHTTHFTEEGRQGSERSGHTARKRQSKNSNSGPTLRPVLLQHVIGFTLWNHWEWTIFGLWNLQCYLYQWKKNTHFLNLQKSMGLLFIRK